MDPQDQTSLTHPQPLFYPIPRPFQFPIQANEPYVSKPSSYSMPFVRPNSNKPIPHQQKPDYIPRPPNAFILFHSRMIRELTDLKGRRQAEVSATISKAWRDATPDVKQELEELAKVKLIEHRARYPNYRFSPRKKQEKLDMYRNRTRHLEEAKRDLDAFEKAYHRADHDVRDHEAWTEREKRALRDEIRRLKFTSLKVAQVRPFPRHKLISCMMTR